MSDVNAGKLGVADIGDEVLDRELERMERDDPDALLLSDYLAGELGAAAEKALVARLANEPALARRLSELSTIVSVARLQGQALQGDDKPAGAGDSSDASRDHTAGGGRFSTLRERWGKAPLFIVACALSVLAGYQLDRYVQRDAVARRGYVDNSEGKDTTSADLAGLMHATVDAGASLAWELGPPRPLQTPAHSLPKVMLIGSAMFEFPATNPDGTQINTPLVTVYTQFARLRVEFEAPCTTLVAVPQGSATVVSRTRGVQQSLTSGEAVRVGCDGAITPAKRVFMPWELPIHVDSVVER